MTRSASLLLLPLIAAVTGCTHTEVTVLFGPRTSEGETDLALTFQVLQQIGESRVRCGYAHSSAIDKGEPFHPEREEITFDHLGCGLKWGGR